jgi:hypothetical protein
MIFVHINYNMSMLCFLFIKTKRRYAEAETDLDFALSHCHVQSSYNKRRILSYLIPIKMSHGKLPSNELLDQYKFNEFRFVFVCMDVCECVNNVVFYHQIRFITHIRIENKINICMCNNVTYLPSSYVLNKNKINKYK